MVLNLSSSPIEVVAIEHIPAIMASAAEQQQQQQQTTLEFYQAMADFENRFPQMDDDVIEAVLRSNQGAVDTTGHQLLYPNLIRLPRS
ncbi:CUE domain-containing protein 1-like [Nasonia vitripennis]|uniref:CUE domain-containing protein n=1 Tax=Nasonia vitripennis TaxID=7425 RepID=A0A7M7QDN5_NASVI|nr:CUE domain-containing protein 1-like [Nasonia vitripennis]